MRETIANLMARARADLEDLVRIPSVSAASFDPATVRQSADATAALFEAEGLSVRIAEIDGAHPAVIAKAPAPPGAPTVLLYAHHDVQPEGEHALWDSPPFEPTERAGRLYGRGTSDDKAGIVAHLTALRAFGGTPPVGVTVFVEGEEEIGSPTLEPFLRAYAGELRADAVILADSANWRVGQPAVTTSLRGLVDCVVEVSTLDHAVHSGQYGGPAPDALTCLSRLLATLHDDKGNVAIGGLVTGPAAALDLTEDEFRAQAGMLPGVELIADGSLTERMWTRPSISVLGIDAPAVAKASNQLVPTARAKVSMRIAPGEDPKRALDALAGHLESSAPWGARVRVERGAAGEPFAVDPSGGAHAAIREAMAQAWDGVAPVDIGIGGSIPFVAAFADAFPDAALILTGAGDPDSRAHGENESLHLADFQRMCVAEALFLSRMAQGV